VCSSDLNMEFYQLACSFGVHPGSDRTYVTLDGLAENMPKAMALFEELLADAQVNKEAYENLASDMLKKRVDAKLNQGQNFNRLIQYAIWGPKSPTTNVLTTAELQQMNPQELPPGIDWPQVLRFQGYTIAYGIAAAEFEIGWYSRLLHELEEQP